MPQNDLFQIEADANIQGDIPQVNIDNLNFYPLNFGQQPHQIIVNPVFLPALVAINKFYPVYSTGLESFSAGENLEKGVSPSFFPFSSYGLQSSIAMNPSVALLSTETGLEPISVEGMATTPERKISTRHSVPFPHGAQSSTGGNPSVASHSTATGLEPISVEGTVITPEREASTQHSIPSAHIAQSSIGMSPSVASPSISTGLDSFSVNGTLQKVLTKSEALPGEIQIEDVFLSPSNTMISNSLVPYAAEANVTIEDRFFSDNNKSSVASHSASTGLEPISVEGMATIPEREISTQHSIPSPHIVQSSTGVNSSVASHSASTGLESFSVDGTLQEILTKPEALPGEIQIEDVSLSPSNALVSNSLVSYAAGDTVTIEDRASANNNKSSVASQIEQPHKLHILNKGMPLLGSPEEMLDTLKNEILRFIKNETPSLQPFLEIISNAKGKIEQLSTFIPKEDDSHITSYVKEFIISTRETLDKTSSDLFKELLNIAKTLADKLDELYSKCISRGSQTDSAELSENLFSGRIPEMVSQAAQASDDFQETGLLIDSFAKGQEDIMTKLKDESQNISKEVGSLVRLSSHPRQNTINNNLMKAIKKVNDGLENLKNLADLAAKENCKNNGDIDEIIKKTEANVVKRLSGSISRKNIDKEVAPTLHRLLKTKQRRLVQSIVRQWEEVIPNKQLKVDSNPQVLPEDKNYKTKSRSMYLGKRCGPSTNRTKYASLPGRLNKPGVPIEELIRAGRRSY